MCFCRECAILGGGCYYSWYLVPGIRVCNLLCSPLYGVSTSGGGDVVCGALVSLKNKWLHWSILFSFIDAQAALGCIACILIVVGSMGSNRYLVPGT